MEAEEAEADSNLSIDLERRLRASVHAVSVSPSGAWRAKYRSAFVTFVTSSSDSGGVFIACARSSDAT